MTPARPKLRSPLKWHGGKGYLARRIVACLPDHTTYCEPFAGGLNVLLNKPRAKTEIVNDLDSRLALFWSVLADHSDESRRFWAFRERACFNKYSRETFALARGFINHPPWPLEVIDRSEHAAFFLMANRMSRGGMGKEFGWSERLRNGMPGDLNAWLTTIDALPAVHERMRGVAVGNRPALDLIRHEWDMGTVLYLDPSYMPETRTTKVAYRHEMSDADHMAMLDALAETSATFFLSGYQSGLYLQYAAALGWHVTTWDIANHASQSKQKQRRTEVLWSNRPFPGSVPCRAMEMVEG